MTSTNGSEAHTHTDECGIEDNVAAGTCPHDFHFFALVLYARAEGTPFWPASRMKHGMKLES